MFSFDNFILRVTFKVENFKESFFFLLLYFQFYLCGQIDSLSNMKTSGITDNSCLNIDRCYLFLIMLDVKCWYFFYYYLKEFFVGIAFLFLGERKIDLLCLFLGVN